MEKDTGAVSEVDTGKESGEGVNNPYAYMASGHVSERLESTQINKFGTKGGTGFAAEEANTLHERMAGQKVEQVGTDNKKNGADRVTNGQPIQTKYYASASKTVRAAFDVDGIYRYEGMQLEVPSDQYDAAVRLMKERIAGGGVSGITNPEAATSIVKKGHVTYRQARNIARAGNIDSLKYDAKNNAVTSSYALAIGFAISFARNRWNGQSSTEALRASVGDGLIAAGTSFVAGVATSQILRTHSARVGTVVARKGVKLIASTKLGRKVIGKVASAASGKALRGAAATNYVSKLLRTNVITNTVTTVAITAPDIYRAGVSKNASWAQAGKNLAINGSSVASGTAGWTGGAVAGASIGTAIFPGIGTTIGATIGGISGALLAGYTGTKVSKIAMDYVIQDDADEMTELLDSKLFMLSDEFLLTEAEYGMLVGIATKACSANFLRDMYASENREEFVWEKFEEECFLLIRAREKVALPDFGQVQSMLDQVMQDVELEVRLEQAKSYVPDFVLIGGVAPIMNFIGMPSVLVPPEASFKGALGVLTGSAASLFK